MIENEPNPPTETRHPRFGLKIALIGAGIAAGAIGATAIGASAQTSAPSATAPSASAHTAAATPPAGGPGGAGPARGHGGASPVRSDEKSLSAAKTATLKAAALKAVPGGTVYRVESDAGDGTYEAHLTKADGTLVTVKFDKFLAVTKVEAGMGAGDPAPAGRPMPNK